MHYFRNYLKFYFFALFACIVFALSARNVFAPSANDSLKKDTGSSWTFHFQATVIYQYHGSFHAAYSGQNSLNDSVEQDMSITATLFLGRRLWKNAAAYFNPEVSGGKGFSGTTGIAGFPNAEVYRVGSPTPEPYIARAYFQQSFALPGSNDQPTTEGVNQVSQFLPAKRITLSVGKFSLADFFDNNPYSHDPRSQFMNWALMDNGAWDYPANTRGYTYAFVAQVITPKWYMNLSDALEPLQANGPNMDWNITETFGLTLEAGYNYRVKNRSGGFSILLYLNQNRAGNYEQAISAAAQGVPNALNIDSLTAYNGNKKYGIGINWNHPIGRYAGIFLRAGWNDGHTGTWAFTEVDQTFTAGISLTGAWWHRKTDNFGLAAIVNGISNPHINFLNSGGYGFIIGDSRLTNYENEIIIEAYYQFQFFEHLFIALDNQYVQNPAYNIDRGPVDIGSIRVHVGF